MDSTAIQPREYRYRDLTRLTSWLRIALYALTAVAALALLSSLAMLVGVALPNPATSGIGALFGLMTFIGAILFFIWIYRAAANVHAFGADVTFTPGWAVGWFLIPVLDLWMSFLVIEELWRGSAGGRDWRRHAAPWSVIAWWGVLVLAVIAAILRALTGGHAVSAVAAAIVAASEIWLSYSFIAIAESVSAMQELQARKVSACP